MGMPTSLNGMIGFIIFVVFIVAIVAPNTTTNEQNVIDAQNNVRDQLNNSINSSSTGEPTGFWSMVGSALGVNGVYDLIIGVFQIGLAFIHMITVYVITVVTVFVSVPAPFMVLFVILVSGLLIGILKLLFLNAD